MAIIIDGWNLIRSSRSEIDDADALDGARELIATLEEYQTTHPDRIVVVFDSTHEHLGIDRRNTDALKVVPSRDADEYIKRYVDRIPDRQRRNVRVVSSDKAVYFYARDSRATAITSEEFWHKIYLDRRRRAGDDREDEL